MSVPLAVVTVIGIWSTTSLAIKWSLHGVGFWLAVALRMGIAAGLCLVCQWLWRIPLPRHRQALGAYALNGLALTIGFAATYWAAQTVDSGLLALMWGLMPLMTGVWASRVLHERFGWPEFLGLLVCLAGLATVFASAHRIDMANASTLLVLLIAILLHAIFLVEFKRQASELPAFATVTGGAVVAGCLFAAIWGLMDGHWPAQIPDSSWSAILYLALAGNLLGMGAYNYLLKQLPASRATLVTLPPPVFALLLGHWLNAEPLGLKTVMGALTIGVGLLIFQRRWPGLSARR